MLGGSLSEDAKPKDLSFFDLRNNNTALLNVLYCMNECMYCVVCMYVCMYVCIYIKNIYLTYANNKCGIRIQENYLL